MTSYSATLPESTSGTVTVRVIDTNRARKELSRDTVQIDAMHFRSEGTTASPESSPNATRLFATGETGVRGRSSGTLANGGSQTITEQAFGKRRNRGSALEHRWTFDLTGQTDLDFVLDAEHLSSSDPDNFLFQYSLDGGQTWTNLLTVTKTSGGQSVAVNLPENTSEVTVRVIDTHRGKDRSAASLRIDEMYFRAR